jgi:hypothetical protein
LGQSIGHLNAQHRWEVVGEILNTLREEGRDEVNEVMLRQDVKHARKQRRLDSICNHGGHERANLAKGLDQHHGVIVEIGSLLLSGLNLAQQHLEGLIIHLLREQAINQLPLDAARVPL